MAQIEVRKNAPVVMTKKGALRGFFYNGVYNFHGVRCADERAQTQGRPEQIIPAAAQWLPLCRVWLKGRFGK